MTPEIQKEVDHLVTELEFSVEDFPDRVNWALISRYQKLSDGFIREFQDCVGWPWISGRQKLSEDFIREFQDRVDWIEISGYQKLSESFIREFQDRVSWSLVSKNQKLSEDFIREFQDRVYWPGIAAFQKLSEDFIREFQDRVDWPVISKHQPLSEIFIREFYDFVQWSGISWHQRLSESFIHEFEHKLNVEVQYKKHHAKIDKEKAIQEYAKKHNLHYADGVLTAYRKHDQWGRGSFNKTIRYEPGKYYHDWHCDLETEEENSFGLGIWPEGNTKVYVKVEDWGVEVNGRDDGKARVWGFTVAEEQEK